VKKEGLITYQASIGMSFRPKLWSRYALRFRGHSARQAETGKDIDPASAQLRPAKEESRGRHCSNPQHDLQSAHHNIVGKSLAQSLEEQALKSSSVAEALTTIASKEQTR
jgi:hypothetical protein